VSISAIVTVTVVTGLGGVPTPVVSVSGNATATPGTVAGVGLLPAPTVSAGGFAPPPVLTHVKGERLAYVLSAPTRHVRAGPLTHVSTS
jgi:hypothetical protein